MIDDASQSLTMKAVAPVSAPPTSSLKSPPTEDAKRAWLRRLIGQRPDSPDGNDVAAQTSAEIARRELDVLRQLRAEIQGLQALLLRIREGQATLTTYAPYVEKNRGEIDDLIRDIGTASRDPRVAEGDDLRYLQNQWQALCCSPVIARPGSQMTAEEQVKELATCDHLCQCMVTRVGNRTIPARLNLWLQDGWNGHVLPFHDLFAEEMPRLEDRQRLLRVLASAPGRIKGGIVEPTSGWILPYHHRPRTRRLVCTGLLLLYVVATVSIWLLGLTDWDKFSARSSERVIQWLLVVVGVLTHYAIDRGKMGTTGGYSAIPLANPTYVIDARAGSIILKGVLMLVGFFALVLLSGDPGNLDFFLVGYGLDSFIGIVSSSLDKRAAARVTELQKAFGS